jgi:hypothetical protein
MVDESVIRFKEQLKSDLRFRGSNAESLDKGFAEISKGMHPLFLGILIGVSICAWIVPIFGIFFSFIALLDVLTKLTFKRRQFEFLSGIVANYLCETRLNRLNSLVSSITLRSLREASWNTTYCVSFVGHESFAYHTNSSHIKPQTSSTASLFDRSRSALEISQGIFVQIQKIEVRLKCDFRVIRTEMSPQEVAHIFRMIADILGAAAPIESIDVEQYSSTKKFRFSKDYLDSGTIAYIWEKTKRVAPSFSYEPPQIKYESKGNNSDKPQQNNIGNSTNQDKLKTPVASNFLRPKSSPLLLSAMLEKRKRTELVAMDTVIEHELRGGRVPKDVSKLNLGFDILSTNSSGEERRIEVKGLSTRGDVILTQNEVTAASNYNQDFYVYIVHNCDSKEYRRLYIMQGLTMSDIEARPAEYEITIDQQNCNADEIIQLGRN